MEALKQALLALTHNVYNFTAAPGTAPPYLVWQVDGGNDLSAGNIHVETAAVVIVDLFTKQAADPLAQSVPRAMEGIGEAGISTPRSTRQRRDYTTMSGTWRWCECPRYSLRAWMIPCLSSTG